MKDKRIQSYRITNQLLGSGSFSEVYLGFTSSQEKVAVKVIPRHKIKENQINVFESQIKLLNNCKNQHIINCIDVKKTKSNFYIFLQYCNNGNLAEYIAQHKKLQENEAMRIFIQILKGMNAMRKLNIIHRDLKPANIMLKENNIKIVDFGLARKYSKGQMLRTFAGTPLNMAPQILKGQLYNEKADVYSAGTILYEMLFGVNPYTETDKNSLVKKIEGKCLNKQKGVRISNDVKQLLEKILQPNPENRIDFSDLLIETQKWENKQIEKRLKILRKSSACAMPYMSILGGLCIIYKFDFDRVKQRSVYDMDLRICGKVSQKLIKNELQWLSNIDLIRV